MQSRIPTGTVTFLFTDIEGSTRLWEAHPEEMQHAFRIHEEILRAAIRSHNGYAYKMIGDAFQAAFQTAPEAAQAAISAQRALTAADWPPHCEIRVRMALHTGETEERGDDYVGPLLNRAARLMSAGHGGQVLVTGVTRALLEDGMPDELQLRFLGEKRLKDLVRPEQIYQLSGPDLADEYPPLQTLDRFRQNLPLQATEFIGRNDELAAVKKALLRERVVTLRGSGGIGKSRLSLQAAADLLSSFPDGVWFAGLASVSEPGLLLKTILNAPGLREDSTRTPVEILVDFFRMKQSLLVLDNCEHLIHAVADVVSALIAACPQLTVLATSREALDVPGERVFDLASLSLPEPNGDYTVDALLQTDSVRLFVTRARTAFPDFELTGENAAALGSLIQRLDGIPLAIELAAARVRMLSIEQIDVRLTGSLDLLKTRSRSMLPHQQTMRALLDWSFDLLSEAERSVFLQLSVFSGGWTLDAAEIVCIVPGVASLEILDLLDQLAGKSLIEIIRIQGRETRYRLLEPVRQYAAERLAAAGLRPAACVRHLNCFLDLVEAAEPCLRTADQAKWFARLEADHDNLVTAIERSISGLTDAETGLRLAGKLGIFWYVRGYIEEGQSWLERLLDAADPGWEVVDLAAGHRSLSLLHTVQGNLAAAQLHINRALDRSSGQEFTEDFATALLISGLIGYFRRDDPAETRAVLETCLTRSREIGFDWGVGESLHILGHIASIEKDFIAAQSYFGQSVQVLRDLGDDFSLSHPLNDLGRAAQHLGDLETAWEMAIESLALANRLDFTWSRALALADLGKIALAQGDLEAAAEHLLNSLRTAADVGDKLRIVESLTYLGYLACERGDKVRVTLLLGAVEAQREALEYPLAPAEESVQAHYLDRYEDIFREPIDRETWDRGRLLEIDQAILIGLEMA